MAIRKIKNIPVEEIEAACKASFTIVEVIDRLGLGHGGTADRLRKLIDSLGIPTTHFTGALWNKGKTADTDDRIATKHGFDEVFRKNSPFASGSIRSRYKRLNTDYHCQVCKLSEWNGTTITLQIDHINGDNSDNSLENLRWICPNCHSQTDTYAGRNVGKIKIPQTKGSLKLLIPAKILWSVSLKPDFHPKGETMAEYTKFSVMGELASLKQKQAKFSV